MKRVSPRIESVCIKQGKVFIVFKTKTVILSIEAAKQLVTELNEIL